MNCDKCKEKNCIAISNIWDGNEFFALPRDIINRLKKCQLEYILFNLSMKDCWVKSDLIAERYIKRLIEEKK